MKDLYTFDWNESKAQETYKSAKSAYSAFFDDLKLSYLIAEAASGNIGGNESDEFHLMSSKGEDDVVSCDTCNYVANEEVAKRDDGFPERTIKVSVDQMRSLAKRDNLTYECNPRLRQFTAFTKGSRNVLQIIIPARGENPKDTAFNGHVLKELFPDIDLSTESLPSSSDGSLSDQVGSKGTVHETHMLFVIDRKISCDDYDPAQITIAGRTYPAKVIRPGLDLMKVMEGDECPNKNCSGKLKIQKCVEIGHTFHLGTRYSTPLNASVSGPTSNEAINVTPASTNKPAQNPKPPQPTANLPLQMGCHGIGLSRLIAAAAHILKDAKGLNWPRAMAPFEAVIVPTLGLEDGTCEVYDLLNNTTTPINDTMAPVDCIIDDRTSSFASKMKDADLIGYPIIVVVGRGWSEGEGQERKCQVQCRRLNGFVGDVPLMDLRAKISELLDQL